MGKKKQPNTKRNRSTNSNSGSKDATRQQQKSDLVVVDVVKASADNSSNFDFEDATPTTASSAPNDVLVAAEVGINAVVIGKHENSSDDTPATSSSSSEKQLAQLADDTSFIGNVSLEMNDEYYGSERIINGDAQRGDANDDVNIQQPPNNNMIAEQQQQQQQQHVEGVVVYNNEGERNYSVEGGATTTTTTTTNTTTSADDTKRVHWRSSADLEEVISSFSEDEDTPTTREDKNVFINEDVALDIDAEASIRNTNARSEQWITKMIQIILARSCCYKVMRHDSTTPRR